MNCYLHVNLLGFRFQSLKDHKYNQICINKIISPFVESLISDTQFSSIFNKFYERFVRKYQFPHGKIGWSNIFFNSKNC